MEKEVSFKQKIKQKARDTYIGLAKEFGWNPEDIKEEAIEEFGMVFANDVLTLYVKDQRERQQKLRELFDQIKGSESFIGKPQVLEKLEALLGEAKPT